MTTLVVLLLSFLLFCDARSYQHHAIDSTDVCILTCDGCFKNKLLMHCANHCIDTGGEVEAVWKLVCPLFGDTPSVQQL